MKSLILKRSVALAGHKTSVSLEDAFWRSLKEIAAYQHVTLSALLVSIDSGRDHGNLSSAIRLFVLNFYRDLLEAREQSERVQAIHPPSSNGRYEPFTRACIQFEEDCAASQLRAGEEISRELVVTCGDGAEVLEPIEEALDQIAFTIECEVRTPA